MQNHVPRTRTPPRPSAPERCSRCRTLSWSSPQSTAVSSQGALHRMLDCDSNVASATNTADRTDTALSRRSEAPQVRAVLQHRDEDLGGTPWDCQRSPSAGGESSTAARRTLEKDNQTSRVHLRRRPQTDWSDVWTTVSVKVLSDEVRSAWYRVVRDAVKIPLRKAYWSATPRAAPPEGGRGASCASC